MRRREGRKGYLMKKERRGYADERQGRNRRAMERKRKRRRVNI